ncbi:MAG: M15 family metallopeptidase [Fimbriimonadales bacterium]|nr:M15 family metallopeptidase [Fimbriimonadales bacterium]
MPPKQKVSTHEPVSQLRRVKIVECDEPLVNYHDLCQELLLDDPVWDYTRETLLRQSVAERLCAAALALPKGYRLLVLEGWRPVHIQRRMWLGAYRRWKEKHPDWSETALKRLTNRFTAPLDERVPPPHTTGGAIDLRLADAKGRPLDMRSPFDSLDKRMFPFDAKGISEIARKHRMILKEAMESAGITNYPSEYWHWSFGDQGWAYRGGHDYALYGQIQPANYKPKKGEDTDEPLTWVADDTW